MKNNSYKQSNLYQILWYHCEAIARNRKWAYKTENLNLWWLFSELHTTGFSFSSWSVRNEIKTQAPIHNWGTKLRILTVNRGQSSVNVSYSPPSPQTFIPYNLRKENSMKLRHRYETNILHWLKRSEHTPSTYASRGSGT